MQVVCVCHDVCCVTQHMHVSVCMTILVWFVSVYMNMCGVCMVYVICGYMLHLLLHICKYGHVCVDGLGGVVSLHCVG